MILGEQGFESDWAAVKSTPGLDNNNQVRYWRVKMGEAGAAEVAQENVKMGRTSKQALALHRMGRTSRLNVLEAES